MYSSDLASSCTERLIDDNICKRKTFLSTNVKKLVCYKSEELVDQTDNNLFLKDGILDWMKIEKHCNINNLMSGFSSNEYDYQLAVSHLYPLSSSVHNYLSQYTVDEFKEQYIVQLEWTAKKEALLRCFHFIKMSQPGLIEASLLLVTSTLERILGDIFMSCSNAAHCPLILKDLLGMKELKSVLGEIVIHCLEIYIGMPSALNLRNLAWHGFLSQGELDTHYVSFLIMMALSLGELVKTKNKSLIKLKERRLIKYSKPIHLQDIFPEVQTDNLPELFRKSSFVSSSMVEMWNLALHFYEKERFADAVMIMLPQLEHSLRRVYACYNNLPERVQTAESSEFYTTFNEILSPVLADGRNNNLMKVINTCYTEMLLDILVHPEGPRLRDHIAHGEVEILDFPKEFANHLFCISIAFCVKFCSDKEFTSAVELFLEISKVANSYTSIFHPNSCLQRECLSYIENLLEWEKLPKPNDEEFVCDKIQSCSDIILCKETIQMVLKKCDDTFEITQQDTRHDCAWEKTVLQEVLLLLKKTRLSTLFRPRHELEVIAILRNIVNQSLQTSKQIQQTTKSRYEEWEKKELRSRQRNNYRRLWFHFPFIKEMMCLYAVVLVLELMNIDQNHNETRVKFLKHSLQCAENLASLSSSSRNRWQECADIATLWMHKTCNYYSSMVNKNT